MTMAPPTPLRCNRACRVTWWHDSHLFVIGLGQYALRSNRREATVMLPDGTQLTRSQPDAIKALKFDVRNYFARLGVAS